MASSYTRTFFKTTGQVINASDFNTEFQLIDNAFDESTGHKHDGSNDEGALVPLISDSNNYTSVEVDEANEAVHFHVNVSNTKVRQLSVQDGALVPTATNDIDLGTTLLKFKDVYVEGTIHNDSVVEEAPIDGTQYGRRNGAWEAVSANSIAWGNITGTLSNQLDLQAALDGKAASSHTHVEADITDLQAYLLDAPSDGTQYARQDGGWVAVASGGTAWGDITGTLSAQLDLQAALDGKAASVHTHTKSQITDFNETDYATGAEGDLATTAHGWGDHALAGYLTDAPSDGSEYVRLNGAWAVASGGGGSFDGGTITNPLVIDPTSSNVDQLLRINSVDSVADQALTAAYIDVDMSGSDTTTADRLHRGLVIDIDSTASGGDTSNEHRIYGILTDIQTTGDSDLIYGVYAYNNPRHTTGTVSENRAVYAYARSGLDGSNTDVNTTVALYGYAHWDSAFTTTSSGLYGVYARALIDNSANASNLTARGVYGEVEMDDAGTLATARAFQAEIDRDAGTITNAYLYYGNYATLTGITNAYGLYILDNIENYIQGNLTVDGTLTVGGISGQSGSLVLIQSVNLAGTSTTTFTADWANYSMYRMVLQDAQRNGRSLTVRANGSTVSNLSGAFNIATSNGEFGYVDVCGDTDGSGGTFLALGRNTGTTNAPRTQALTADINNFGIGINSSTYTSGWVYLYGLKK